MISINSSSKDIVVIITETLSLVTIFAFSNSGNNNAIKIVNIILKNEVTDSFLMRPPSQYLLQISNKTRSDKMPVSERSFVLATGTHKHSL